MIQASSVLELATQMRAAFDDVAPPERGLGTQLGDEIRALRHLMDRVESVYLERLAAFDACGGLAVGRSTRLVTAAQRSRRGAASTQAAIAHRSGATSTT